MKFFKRPEPVVDTDAVALKADASLKRTKAQEPRVTAIATWLNNRREDNGFGEDIEITFRPKEA